MIAIIGGEPHRFRPLVDLYRQAGARAGHAPETLKVGIHALGYVAETDAKAAEDFFPGYAETFSKIGEERGWGPVTRGQFNALLSRTGALVVGSPETVAEKVRHYDKVLGGIERLSFQMSVAGMGRKELMSSIELAGTKVKPILLG
jgi:alkanesulfonate monooxygenase SsuD/methylene tetrahydromethanopterin reductase-like flavin-dependent oxidoreductase (luciferase family)